MLHIDSLGMADPLPFGSNDAPYVIVRVHPMEGDLSRYSVTSSDPDDEPEEDILQTSLVPNKIVHTSKTPRLILFLSQINFCQ